MARKRERGDRGTVATEAGLVIARYGQKALIEGAGGERIDCSLRRKLGDIVCGDRVRWRLTDSGQGVVESLERRKQLLVRHDTSGKRRLMAANIDCMVVVVAARPPPSAGQTDRYLVAAELSGIEAVVVLNKCDLLEPPENLPPPELADYPSIGYPLIHLSSHQPASLAPLTEQLHDRCAIICGQSGVGKSSLIDALIPNQSIGIGPLHRTSGHGTHTTTTATLYHMPTGGSLIDSPGIREFGLWPLEPEELIRGFPEISRITDECRFRNCRHLD